LFFHRILPISLGKAMGRWQNHCAKFFALRRRFAMPIKHKILKVGLAVTDYDRLLLVRKRGTVTYILPGGKPEKDEDDLRTLSREIEEELGCQLDARTVVFLGCFSDHVADDVDTMVTVRLYRAKLVGTPTPRAEIEELKWFCPSTNSGTPLAPSLTSQIIPYLSSHGYLNQNAARSQAYSR
jgi:8-oxo-dGTP diphosphatase